MTRLFLAGLVLALVLAAASGQISDKGRKLAGGDSSNLEYDPWLEEAEQTVDDDDFSEDDDFFDFTFDDIDSFGDDDDPLFSSACEDANDTRCDGGVPDVPRFHDRLLEQVLLQTWADFQAQLTRTGEVAGLPIEPLDVDSQLSEPINVSQSSNSYTADMQMSGIRIYGLSSIDLSECSVLRNENLTDMQVRLTLAFEQILLNGTYSLRGTVGWWQLNSQGLQDFSISMINATIGVQIDLVKLAGPAEPATPGSEGLECPGQEGSVLLTHMAFPLNYDDINFRFNNLGAFANTMVNGVGIYFLQSQEETLIEKVKSILRESMSSLMCQM